MTARSLESYYKIDGDGLERAYKEHLSGYRQWIEGVHADKYLVFPENVGLYMSIDETSTKDGELFTILSNKDRHCKKGSIAAIIRGTRIKDVTEALMQIPEDVRMRVIEVTLDFSGSMAAIVESAFPWADRTLDRFHMHRMAIDALNDLRNKYRREAMAEEAAARKEHGCKERERLRKNKKFYHDFLGRPLPKPRPYIPKQLANGDTVPELLVRSAYLLKMSADKWSDTQKERASILFDLYPEIKQMYGLAHSLRMIFNNKKATIASAKSSLHAWYQKALAVNNENINTMVATLQSREEEVLNFFKFRSTNASAEALNSKIKAFRAQLRGIVDLKFFLFRLTRIYA